MPTPPILSSLIPRAQTQMGKKMSSTQILWMMGLGTWFPLGKNVRTWLHDRQLVGGRVSTEVVEVLNGMREVLLIFFCWARHDGFSCSRFLGFVNGHGELEHICQPKNVVGLGRLKKRGHRYFFREGSKLQKKHLSKKFRNCQDFYEAGNFKRGRSGIRLLSSFLNHRHQRFETNR